MFTAIALPTVRLTMSSRRRGEDNMSLYDFAKKYQENQGSSDLVKKQNATEDKVLSARLQYLNNQKVLTMKTLEKEIDLIKRRKMYGWDNSRKSVSSHHFDRASLPNTPRRWTKDNFSPAKFVKRKSFPVPEPVPQPATAPSTQNHHETNLRVVKNTSGNICKTNTPFYSSKQQQNQNEETLVNELKERHVVHVMEAVSVNIPIETQSNSMSDSNEGEQQDKSSPNPALTKGIFHCNKTSVARDKTNQVNVFPSWSRYSHLRQNLSKPQDTSHTARTPTPRAKAEELENEEQCITGLSVNLSSRKHPSRYHHSHSDNIGHKIENTKFNPLLDLGAA